MVLAKVYNFHWRAHPPKNVSPDPKQKEHQLLFQRLERHSTFESKITPPTKNVSLDTKQKQRQQLETNMTSPQELIEIPYNPIEITPALLSLLSNEI